METVKYVLFDYWQEKGDPRTVHYPLMNGGPLPVLSIIAFYVVFVKWLGPLWMRHRRPYQLKSVLIAYNCFNIVTNLWFFVESVRCLDYGRQLYEFRFPSPNDRSPRALRTCMMLNVFLWSKFIDLLDTVFFVLRKKQSQITFLHVYHHSIVPILIWIASKLVPTAGPAGLFPLMNSAIHAVMYTYYTIAALGPQYRRFLFWKKYITILQLFQFVCYIVHGTLFLILQNGYPGFFIYLGYIQNPLFLFMFYQFFVSTYRSKEQSNQNKEKNS